MAKRHRRALRLLVAIGVAVAMGLSLTASAETIRFAVGEWPPFVSENATGFGMSAEIVTAAANAAGMQAEFDFHPWKRSLLLAENGQVQASFPWSWTRERNASFLYSAPIHSSHEGFFYRIDRFPNGIDFESFASLKGLTLGALHSYWHAEVFRGEGLTFVEIPNYELGLQMLDRGRIDLLPEEQAVGWAFIKERFPGREGEYAVVANELMQRNLYVVFSRRLADSEKLVRGFDEGLATIKRDGRHRRILEQHGMWRPERQRH